MVCLNRLKRLFAPIGFGNDLALCGMLVFAAAVGVGATLTACEDDMSPVKFAATGQAPLPLTATNTFKHTADDGAAQDNYGRSVSVGMSHYGKWHAVTAVGAPADDDLGSGSGAVYLNYHHSDIDIDIDADTDTDADSDAEYGWDGPEVKLTAPDGAAGDGFGWSVAVADTNVLAVGAPGADAQGLDSGVVYLHRRSMETGDWEVHKTLLAPDGAASDRFGDALSLSAYGSYAAVGARWDDDKGLSSGSVYIYGKNEGGSNNYGFTKKLVAPDGDAYDGFGTSVGVCSMQSGEVMVVAGAPFDDDRGSNAGAAYVFYYREATDSWSLAKKLTPADGSAGDLFGYSVAIFEDFIIVGAYMDDPKGTNSGSAYIFRKDYGGEDNWGQEKKLIALDGAAYDYFGISVAITDPIPDSDTGHVAVVGATGDDDKGSGSGSVYLFGRKYNNRRVWKQLDKLVLSDGAVGDNLGNSVATVNDVLANRFVVAGAFRDDESGPNSGSALSVRLEE